jgi:hypothetical protein
MDVLPIFSPALQNVSHAGDLSLPSSDLPVSTHGRFTDVPIITSEVMRFVPIMLKSAKTFSTQPFFTP